jgi:Flp pilus assembly protein TadD
LQPDYSNAYYNRGNVLFAKGHIDEAIVDWEKTLQLQPNDADAHTGLGNALLRKGAVREAIGHYEQALAMAPEDPHSRINIAWVLATSSDASVRDGARAVEFARKAVELSNTKDPKFLRALAAAYAEAGRFSEAIDAAQMGMEIATSESNFQLANLLQGDIALYRIGLPLRQTSPGR